MSELNNNGINSVAYYGEMDIRSRSESFDKWKSGEVKVMVATSAFGMGINKPDIRHIIRYGVPENICSWAQELGRAGRDGLPAKATIFYSSSNSDHAGAWIKGHLLNRDHCNRVLSEFSDSWKYVLSNLAGKCRRKMLLELVGENSDSIVSGLECCDVCGNAADLKLDDQIKELNILCDAITILGPKGELKITQWIRGSNLAWTDSHNKSSMSYGNFRGHSEKWWRLFIRKCHVLGYVRKELRSIIKKSQHYGIQAIITITDLGISTVESQQSLMLPQLIMINQQNESGSSDSGRSNRSSSASGSQSEFSGKKTIRTGKGSHGITIIKNLLLDKENWQEINNKEQYQFPGIFPSPHTQVVYYTPDCTKLPQSTSNPHYLWEDIQISKCGYNKDREVTLDIDDCHEELMYRVSSCNGVKVCPVDSCSYVAPVLAQRPCCDHPSHKLIKTNSNDPCPVQIAYIYPKKINEDHRRWIFAFVGHQRAPCSSLHNHPMHNSTKICSKVKQMIHDAAAVNPDITTTEIAKGKCVCAIPGAIDNASNHSGKLSRELKKAKLHTPSASQWEVSSFEKVADEIDLKDEELNGNDVDVSKLKHFSRPYLVSAGIENGIKFVFCMNPLMCSLLSRSEFIEADITYNESREYRYLFNMVAFNYTTMKWMVVSRVRMDKQDAEAYALAYSKTFTKCQRDNNEFEPGKTLIGIVIDWSDAEIKGIKKALGETVADTLLKGCKVHWARSWQRVRDKVCKSQNEHEKELFSKIASSIPHLKAGNDVQHAFEVLSKRNSAHTLLNTVSDFSKDDANYIDSETNWTAATNWAEWWMNRRHLNLLHKTYSDMPERVWDRCPSDTNAVERKNLESKELTPQPIQKAMLNLYKCDKATCAKHIAAMQTTSLSYRNSSLEGRKVEAMKRNIRRKNSIPKDKNNEYGPPDHDYNFKTSSLKGTKRPADACSEHECAKKRSKSATRISTKCKLSGSSQPTDSCSSHDNSIATNGTNDDSLIHRCNTEYLGKSIKMRFKMDNGCHQWFDGQILHFDPSSGKYGAFFPCDGQTIYIDPTKEKDDIIFST